ncbi:MAG TPA: ferritin-like domain-containing protein [Solirubrobacteraceae bacterium]|nr:ferritin-like domain-containing protein [Solirubrobacteraceae bacterium]
MIPQPRGIVEDLVRDDVGRKKFLKAVGGAGAASFGAFVLAACGSSSSTTSTSTATKAATQPASTTPAASTAVPASFGAGDIGILNYALTLEYLEAEFYAKVKAANLFKGAVGSLVAEFGQQEAEHVAALHQTVIKLGGTPAPKPTGKFPITTAAAVAKLAYTVENLGASAYLGQAGNITNPTVLAAALAIHTVEARHAATLATLVPGAHVTPTGPFAKPADAATVLAAVKPFIA